MIAVSLPTTTADHSVTSASTATAATTATPPDGLRRWLGVLSGMVFARSSVQWVDTPEALAHPPSERARRLMRNARCGGW